MLMFLWTLIFFLGLLIVILVSDVRYEIKNIKYFMKQIDRNTRTNVAKEIIERLDANGRKEKEEGQST